MRKGLPILVLAIVFISIVNSFAEGQDIKTLYKEGIVLYKSGKLEEAKEKFKAILDINPFYEPARTKLRLILDTQTRMLRQDKHIVSRERVLEVQQKWAPPPKEPKPVEEKPVLVRFKTEQQKIMEEKAQQIIPEINFTDAHIRDVLQYLSRVSGINIILDEDIFVQRERGELGIPVEVEVTEGVTETYEQQPAPSAAAVISDRVTISLKNIPLIEALKYILTAKGLKYRIDEYAIIVSTQQRLEEVEMQTKYYHLVSGIGSFTEYIEQTTGEEETFEWEEEAPATEKTTLTIKDVLEQSGVPFPAGSKIFLDQRTGTLIVRNTPSNLAIIEEILHILDVTPYQIEIEARFVQLSSDTAKDLGLEWMVTSGDYRFGRGDGLRWDSDTTDLVYGRYPDPDDLTGNEGVTKGLRYLSDSLGNPLGNILSISGVLTEPEFRVVLHALNQTGDANLVSAPKVTTLNNQRAQIEMVEEFIYPGEFEVTPPTVRSLFTTTAEVTATTYISTDTISTRIITPGIAVPISFETRDLGIILNVTPSVGADRNTITLTLIPEISEFIGWIDYGIKEGIGWNEIPIKKPIFQTRNVTTSVVINDGETVVLGGLVKEELETSEDKIPLLGDLPILGVLFRSKSEISKKTNLVIFVTARLLTPSGELIRETYVY